MRISKVLARRVTETGEFKEFVWLLKGAGETPKTSALTQGETRGETLTLSGLSAEVHTGCVPLVFHFISVHALLHNEFIIIK